MKSPRNQTVSFVNTSFTVFFLSDFTGRRPPPSLYVENGERGEGPQTPSVLGAVLLEDGERGNVYS